MKKKKLTKKALQIMLVDSDLLTPTKEQILKIKQIRLAEETSKESFKNSKLKIS